MPDKPDATLIQSQAEAYYRLDMTDDRAADLAAEVASMLRDPPGTPPGGLDQDPFAFAAVLAALREPGT
jgi:hypothetical protein